MTVTTVSSREFDRDLTRAKRAAKAGPVFITDRGRPAYVLLRIEDYRCLAGAPQPAGHDVHAWPCRYRLRATAYPHRKPSLRNVPFRSIILSHLNVSNVELL